MLKIDEYTQKELYDMSKLTQIRGRSKMNKTELYENITKYFKENYEYLEEYSIFMEPMHIMGYCEKHSLNPMEKIFKNQNFNIIELKLINSIEKRTYSADMVKELSFFLSNGVYHICNNPEYSFLVIETEKYYGFIAPEDEIEEEEDELSLVNTKEEYEKRLHENDHFHNDASEYLGKD